MFIKKCDKENKQLFVLGDLNCNWNKSPLDSHTKKSKKYMYAVHKYCTCCICKNYIQRYTQILYMYTNY